MRGCSSSCRAFVYASRFWLVIGFQRGRIVCVTGEVSMVRSKVEMVGIWAVWALAPIGLLVTRCVVWLLGRLVRV